MKLFLVIFTLFACGCSGISGKLLIMEANYRYNSGNYADAIFSYIKAIESPQSAAYAQYGLGTLYYTIGEDNAALDRFEAALALIEDNSYENISLLYSIHYNTGLVYFNMGDYGRAVNSFRQALKADGGRIDAKRNLELSILSLENESSQYATVINEQDMEENHSKTAMFEYIRQREMNRWGEMEWPDEEEAGPDY